MFFYAAIKDIDKSNWVFQEKHCQPANSISSTVAINFQMFNEFYSAFSFPSDLLYGSLFTILLTRYQPIVLQL